MKTDLLPRSNGDFRLGATNYAKKLLYDEMVDIPLDKLLKIGYADLRANQKAFRETAAKIDKTKTPRDILNSIEKDHPADGPSLLDAFRQECVKLKDFLEAKKIITVPSQVLPILDNY